MIAQARAAITAGGVLACCESTPPLTLRQVLTDDENVCALRLVGTAAGPLSGDDLGLRLEVGPDARAAIRATGAGIAQGRRGQVGSAVRVRAVVGPRAELIGDTGPLIVAQGSMVDVDVEIEMAIDAYLDWQELIVLGRVGEVGGHARLRWTVTVAGRSLLRQTLDLSDPELVASPAMLAGARVIACAVIAGPTVTARTEVLHRSAVLTRLTEHAVLATVLAKDAVAAQDELGALLARYRAAQARMRRGNTADTPDTYRSTRARA